MHLRAMTAARFQNLSSHRSLGLGFGPTNSSEQECTRFYYHAMGVLKLLASPSIAIEPVVGKQSSLFTGKALNLALVCRHS